MKSSRCVHLGKTTNASVQVCTNRKSTCENIQKCENTKRAIRKVECERCVLAKSDQNSRIVRQGSILDSKKKLIEHIKEKPLLGSRGSAKRTPLSLKKVAKKKQCTLPLLVTEKETKTLSNFKISMESAVMEQILKDVNRAQLEEELPTQQKQQLTQADMEQEEPLQQTQESPQSVQMESKPHQSPYQTQELPASSQVNQQIQLNKEISHSVQVQDSQPQQEQQQRQQHQELSNCIPHKNDSCPKLDCLKIQPTKQNIARRDIAPDNEVQLENGKQMTSSICQNQSPSKIFSSFRGEYPTRHRAGTCLQQFFKRTAGKNLRNACSDVVSSDLEVTQSCSTISETHIVSIDVPGDGRDPGSTEDANAVVVSGSAHTFVGCCPGAGPPIGATLVANNVAYDEYNLHVGQMPIDCFAQQQPQQQHKHHYQWQRQRSQMFGNGWPGQTTHQPYGVWPTSGSTQQPYKEAWRLIDPQNHLRMTQYQIRGQIASTLDYHCDSNQAYGNKYIDAQDPLDVQNVSMLITQNRTPEETFNHITQQTYQLADGQILQQQQDLPSQAYVASQLLLQHSDSQQAQQKPSHDGTDPPHHRIEPNISLIKDDNNTKNNTNIRDMNENSSSEMLRQMTDGDHLVSQPKILVSTPQMDNHYQLVYTDPQTSFPQSQSSQQQSSTRSAGKISRQNCDSFTSKSMHPISSKAKSVPSGNYIQSLNEQMLPSRSANNVYSPICQNNHCCSACCRQRFAQMRFMMPRWR